MMSAPGIGIAPIPAAVIAAPLIQFFTDFSLNLETLRKSNSFPLVSKILIISLFRLSIPSPVFDDIGIGKNS